MVKQVEEPTYNKWALIIVGGLIVLIALAAVIYQQGYNAGKNEMTAKINQAVSDAVDKVSESEVVTDTTSTNDTIGPTIPKVDEPIVLSGYGNQETKPIQLETGLYDVKLTHNGSGNFIIWIVNHMGTKLDYLVNEIGTYDKLRAMHITNTGEHTFDVTASGNWSLTISEYTLR